MMASGEGEGGQREQSCSNSAVCVHAVLILVVQGGPPEPLETHHVMEVPTWAKVLGLPNWLACFSPMHHQRNGNMSHMMRSAQNG